MKTMTALHLRKKLGAILNDVAKKGAGINREGKQAPCYTHPVFYEVVNVLATKTKLSNTEDAESPYMMCVY